jgi:hypothetical protein
MNSFKNSTSTSIEIFALHNLYRYRMSGLNALEANFEPMEMSDESISVHKCEHCESHSYTNNTQATNCEVIEKDKDNDITKDTTKNQNIEPTTEITTYRTYIASALTAAVVAIGCIACHHIACPVLALKAGIAGGAKLAATKGTIHQLLARTAGGQCCCCSCGGGCSGCCPCGNACCWCSC